MNKVHLLFGGGGGGFNLIFDSQLDSDGGNPRLKIQSLSKPISMMSENELCDIFRVRNLDVKQFTWRNKNPFIQKRLDYFILSEGLQNSIEIMDTIPSVQSDHSVLKLKISPINERTRGPSSWKFNNSLVHDSNFVRQMKLKIPSFYQESLELSDARGRWEYMKYKMREFSMTFSKQKAYQRKKRRIFLENRVKTFETKLATSSDEEIIEQCNMAKNELESIYDCFTEDIILRPKASWYEHGEKSTQYFLNLEKRNKAKSHLRRIFISENVETTNPDQIVSSLKSFYSALYKRRSENSEAECLDFLGNLNIPKLIDDDRTSCDGKLTLNECWEALKSMDSSKRPGNDGLTKEFYVCFFKDVGQYLIDALNLSFDYGMLSTSQRQAVITLVEKKGKDKRYFKNWRAISLINVDTKSYQSLWHLGSKRYCLV